MKNQHNRISRHVRKHKVAYAVGLSLGVGAIAGLAVGYRIPRERMITVSPKQILTYKSTQNIEIFIEALGDPGNIVQDTTTGTIYASQNQAAKAVGVTSGEMSKHLNGLTNHVGGHTFIRLGKAAVQDLAEKT